MPTRYEFKLATMAEEGALRSILRQTSMPGKISLSFQREPDFFLAEHAGNSSSQVIVVQDAESNKIVGFGCRGLRRAYVDGETKTIGYLAGLRGLPEVRGGTLLARAYKFIKELHGDGKVPYYVTTIFDDNVYAKTLLTSGRAGLPVYHPLGSLRTYLIPLYRRQRGIINHHVVKVAENNLQMAVRCINSFNSQYQLSPNYSTDDFLGQTDLLPHLKPQNLYAYIRDSHITATLGVWDQTPFKQSVVAGYSKLYSTVRPLLNVTAAMGFSAKLPRVGQSLPYLYAPFLSYSPGHGEDFLCLLCHILAEWSQKGFAYLLLGLHEKHPLASTLQKSSAITLSSTVYVVHWKDGLNDALPSQFNLPHLEIATL